MYTASLKIQNYTHTHIYI